MRYQAMIVPAAAIATLLLVAPSTAAAQRPAQVSGRLWSTALEAPSAPHSSGIFGDGSRDFRYAGFWVGAAAGVGMAFMAHQFCEGSDNGCQASLGAELLGTLFVAGMTGTMGALLGAQFSREPPQGTANPE